MSTGEQRRDEGMAAVAENNAKWAKPIYDWVKALAVGHEFFIEDIRLALTDGLLDKEKPSPNYWGSVATKLLRAELIEKTGDRRKMQDPRSHARMTDVYRRIA